MNLRVRPEARDDLLAAMAWYDEREKNLGAAFLEHADALFQQIDMHPARFPVVYRTFRRALMRRFPYAVYYIVEDNAMIVFAVLHQRQDRSILTERRS